MRLKKPFLFGVLTTAALVAALLPGPASASVIVTQVISGLNSPRGIGFDHGVMYVAEAGVGSSNASDCFVDLVAGKVCIGATGRVSKIAHGTRTTLVDGLFSETARDGFDSEGPSGLSISGGRILVQIATPPQEVPSTPPPSAQAIALGKAQAGHLISVRRNGKWSTVAKVGEFDFNYATNLANQGVIQEKDANPYGVLATEDGAFVADAGSNTLDWVSRSGKVKVLVYDGFRTGQPFPTDAVPTCVVKTEDGLLVGELSGRVLKVHGGSFTVINDPLFTHITGCTSDEQGNVYFVNMFGSGTVFTPPPDSNFFIGNVVKYDPETGKASMLADGLLLPNMDTIGPDGNLYVTVGSNCPLFAPVCNGATGGVVKITLPHDEGND